MPGALPDRIIQEMTDMTRLEEQCAQLSPEGRRIALAFVEFLLSREEEEGGPCIGEEQEDEFSGAAEAFAEQVNEVQPAPSGDSGIILAEERAIDEKNDLIDFADINTRFTKKPKEREPPRPVRQRKMFDWL